jgi:hypothetical protein
MPTRALLALTILTAATFGLLGCTPNADPATDDKAPPTASRSVPAPLCASDTAIISEPCSEVRRTARAAGHIVWRFYPHKGDEHTFTDMSECSPTGITVPCMAVPRDKHGKITGTPAAILTPNP